MKRLILAFGFTAALVFAQDLEDKAAEHKSFSGARELIVDNVNGHIEVTGYNGSTVEIDVERTFKARSQDRLNIARKEVTLESRQEGGMVQMAVHHPDHSNDSWWRQVYEYRYDFKVRVPRGLYLELRTVNDSHISVDGTSGDYKISNVNGEIEMKEVEGAGSVQTVNGKVVVTFARNPKAATSFKSVNGTLDVSFRPGLNADARLKTMNGGLYTDFAVTALPVAASQPEQRNGKFVWKSNRMTGVRIGSGGPELSFETLNGSVLIKNREK